MFREMDRTFDQFRASWWNEYAHTTPGLESGRPALEDERGQDFSHSHGHEHRHTHTPTLERTGSNTTASLEDEGDAYVFVMDLPGFEKTDIDLTLDDGMLSVRAHRDVEAESDTRHTTRSRRVSRQVEIPTELVLEDVTASYRNGVLEVHLPIVESEQETSHHIDIE